MDVLMFIIGLLTGALAIGAYVHFSRPAGCKVFVHRFNYHCEACDYANKIERELLTMPDRFEHVKTTVSSIWSSPITLKVWYKPKNPADVYVPGFKIGWDS